MAIVHNTVKPSKCCSKLYSLYLHCLDSLFSGPLVWPLPPRILALVGAHSTHFALQCRHIVCGQLQGINNIKREISNDPLGLCDLTDPTASLVPLVTS